ncbi:GNAT family N-acetyltransferase [Elusimicrobiota bacterium]
MYIEGEQILLRPIEHEEMIFFYEMATESDAAQYLYGEYTGEEIPDYEDFVEDWGNFEQEYEEDADLGMCFFIVADGNIVGVVSYGVIGRDDDSTQIDILIADEDNMNRGYATEAISVLIEYLFEELNVQKCIAEIPADNKRAKRTFEKAGFIQEKKVKRNNINMDVLVIENFY